MANQIKIRHTLLNGTFNLCDTDGTLKLFSEPSETGQKGLVYEGNNEIMKPFPKVENMDLENLKKNYPDLSGAKIWDHHEGCLLRVYWSSQGWRLSTQKKIDAFRSRWGSRHSFGESWVKALPNQDQAQPHSFFTTLDKKCQYLFLLSNNKDNRIVCNVPREPTVKHVGTWVNGTLRHDIDVGIDRPCQYEYTKHEELASHFDRMDWKQVTGCLICLRSLSTGGTSSAGGKWVRVVHPEYARWALVRNNEPSLPFRYLQVRLDGEMTTMLYELFPQYAEKFDLYEDTIYDIACYLHSCYMSRYVHKQFVTVDREFFPILRMCHKWHTEDREHNKVTLDKVIEMINSRYDHVLNKMIRTFIRNKKEPTPGGAFGEPFNLRSPLPSSKNATPPALHCVG
jgi:hypothetical protein